MEWFRQLLSGCNLGAIISYFLVLFFMTTVGCGIALDSKKWFGYLFLAIAIFSGIILLPLIAIT